MRAELLILKQKTDSGMLRTQLGATAVAAAPKKKSSALVPILAVLTGLIVLTGAVGGLWWVKHRVSKPVPPPEVALVPPSAPTPPAHFAAAAQSTPAPDQGMTNQNVLDMVEAKVPYYTIVTQIHSAPQTNFDLSTKGIIDLTKGGVSSTLIEVMRNPKSAAWTASATPAPKGTPATPPPASKAAPASTPAPTPAPAVVAAPVTPPPASTPAPAAPTPAPVVPTTIHTVVVPGGTPFTMALTQNVPLKPQPDRNLPSPSPATSRLAM